MSSNNILIIGAGGQIGVELVQSLRKKNRGEVIASDLHLEVPANLANGPYEQLDILDDVKLRSVVSKYEISEVYLLAAMLSATAEKNPLKAWSLNINGLLNVLELAKEGAIKKVFWPSSIAVFGPTTPRRDTPQRTVMEPTSIYGISKLSGERWCEYYHQRFGVDVRSIRYPGLISWSSPPGGGTTDYAVDIFHHAIENGSYECFLTSDTFLPMMHMSDAVRGTIELMNAPADRVKIRSSYNMASMTFSPAELAEEIKKLIPEFSITYKPDFRQFIADSWPESIDDSEARAHWGWSDKYDLQALVKDMIQQLKLAKEVTS